MACVQTGQEMSTAWQRVWIQVQSMVRELYWSRQDVAGHDVEALLHLGLKFSDMGLAWLNDDPRCATVDDALAPHAPSATHDLHDLVARRVATKWFVHLHHDNISTLLADYLPVRLLPCTLPSLPSGRNPP